MSGGTVKTHLSHIFTKLDAANRTELAAAAIDRGPSTVDRRTLAYAITQSHEPAATTPAGLPKRAFLEGVGLDYWIWPGAAHRVGIIAE
jgi:hypothetical protein